MIAFAVILRRAESDTPFGLCEDVVFGRMPNTGSSCGI
jgi:hypothetical protein